MFNNPHLPPFALQLSVGLSKTSHTQQLNAIATETRFISDRKYFSNRYGWEIKSYDTISL